MHQPFAIGKSIAKPGSLSRHRGRENDAIVRCPSSERDRANFGHRIGNEGTFVPLHTVGKRFSREGIRFGIAALHAAHGRKRGQCGAELPGICLSLAVYQPLQPFVRLRRFVFAHIHLSEPTIAQIKPAP